MTLRYLVVTTLIGVSAALVMGAPREALAAPPNEAVFELSTRGSARADSMWCAAADYARRGLGADWDDVLYVAKGKENATSGRGVVVSFTLDPVAAGIEPLASGQSFDTLAVGYSMSVQRAKNLCNMPSER